MENEKEKYHKVYRYIEEKNIVNLGYP